MPDKIDDKKKYAAVVQENKLFSKLKENVNYSGQKIKLSKYELDWIDVKLEKNQVDYVLSSVLIEDMGDFEEFISEFLYMSEFVAKKGIGIMCLNEISDSLLGKFKLEVKKKDIVVYGEKEYIFYLLGRRKKLIKRRVRKLAVK